MSDDWLRYLTYLVALVVGTGLVWSVALTCHRNKAWSVTAFAAAALGVGLMGLSVWSQVKITIDGAKVSAEFHRLQEQNTQLAAAVLDLDDALQQTRRAVAEVSIQAVLPQAQLDPRVTTMVDSLRLQPLLDRGALKTIADEQGIRR